MNILLTNDDGFQADGINRLKNYFEDKNHSVFIVAPAHDQSGTSHSITLKDTIRLHKHYDRTWVLNGTPADCTYLGLLGLVGDQIDLVISGVNHGPNIGRDIIYSGTVAAARQAGLYKVPAMALSADCKKEALNFEPIEYFLNQYFERLVQSLTGMFIFNINFPNLPRAEINGVKKTFPAQEHFYEDELVCFNSPSQGKYYWIKGERQIIKNNENTDYSSLKSGFISVSAIKILPEEYQTDFDL